MWLKAALITATAVLAGCAFDVSFVKSEPAQFTAAAGCGPGWTLLGDESVAMGTGFATRLKAGTRWRCIGTVEAGQVYRTDDQVVTVEASNIYEAQAVIDTGRLVGFYLPVEKRFARAPEAILLQKKETTP